MGDDEARREDARQEVLIDRAIREGKIMYCHLCGERDWIKLIEVYDYPADPVPLCRDCAREHEGRY